MHAMEADSGIRLKELRVDGGASRNDLLMQFQANVLGIPVIRPVVSETTAWGAAALAGLATGVWKNQHDLRSCWNAEKTFLPQDTSQAARLNEWRRAVERSKSWISHES